MDEVYVTILGKKPSEIRKAIVSVASAILILSVALPIAGLPVAVTAVIAAIVGVAGGVTVYFTKNEVAAVIDSADSLTFGS